MVDGLVQYRRLKQNRKGISWLPNVSVSNRKAMKPEAYQIPIASMSAKFYIMRFLESLPMPMFQVQYRHQAPASALTLSVISEVP